MRRTSRGESEIMTTTKVQAGSVFPAVTAPSPEGQAIDIGAPTGDNDWIMVVVYRGKHCPLCTKYLNTLEDYRQQLRDINVDLVAVSADSEQQLAAHREKLNVTFPLLYGLTIEQMQELGLYISHPRSEKETDHPFAEPGLFVVNADRQVQVVDLSNNPFVRPELDALTSGLAWIRDPDNNYPIRGTFETAS